jgi:threonine dehydrogenase-like Zn-dependent dehydrogenase
MYGAGDVRVETVPDAHLIEATDALVRVRRAAICGSDLWPYKSMEPTESGRRMGHEFIGVVEDVGTDVNTIKAGDVVVSPFLWSDGTCVFCREGLQSECLHGGRYGFDDVDGGQGEAVRVPQADGTLVVLPVGADVLTCVSLMVAAYALGTSRATPRRDRPSRAQVRTFVRDFAGLRQRTLPPRPRLGQCDRCLRDRDRARLRQPSGRARADAPPGRRSA